MSKDVSLYFIAIIPPSDINMLIDSERKDFAERFHSFHALKTIPHITLIAPFKRSGTIEMEMHLTLQDFFESVAPFRVDINGYGSFQKQNKVLFYKVEKSKEIVAMHRALVHKLRTGLRFTDKETSYMYHPHITIAHRDLTDENFEIAWNELEKKAFSSSFKCEKACLLKHDLKSWKILSVFDLRKADQQIKE